MVRLAVRGRRGLEASTWSSAARPSYTVDTLRELRALLPAGAEVVLLLGRRPGGTPPVRESEAVRGLATVAGFARPGFPAPRGADLRVEAATPDVSSTDVRRRVAAGSPWRPRSDDVAAYIRERGLYRAPETPGAAPGPPRAEVRLGAAAPHGLPPDDAPRLLVGPEHEDDGGARAVRGAHLRLEGAPLEVEVRRHAQGPDLPGQTQGREPPGARGHRHEDLRLRPLPAPGAPRSSPPQQGRLRAQGEPHAGGPRPPHQLHEVVVPAPAPHRVPGAEFGTENSNTVRV